MCVCERERESKAEGERVSTGMPSLSTLKARAQGVDTTVADPVIEAAKALPRIDKVRTSLSVRRSVC